MFRILSVLVRELVRTRKIKTYGGLQLSQEIQITYSKLQITRSKFKIIDPASRLQSPPSSSARRQIIFCYTWSRGVRRWTEQNLLSFTFTGQWVELPGTSFFFCLNEQEPCFVSTVSEGSNYCSGYGQGMFFPGHLKLTFKEIWYQNCKGKLAAAAVIDQFG